MIIQLWPLRIERGTIAAQRADAASLALTERNVELARQRSDRSRKGWRTRRQGND